MAITRYAGDRFTIADGETKPTGVLDGAYLIDTGNLTQFVRRTVGGTSQWSQLAGGGGGGTPGGANTQVQFNNGGSFGGDADLTFTNGNRLNVNKLGISGNIYDSNNSIGEGGMVLTNEGTTGVNWKSIESVLSGVGGSGVANYVARWSDEDTLTSGIIYDNASKVGISTASPQAELHIYAGTTAGDHLLVESTNTAAGDAPDLVLYRNSPSPANSDDLGIIRFRGKNNGTDTGFGENKVIYADIEAEITSVVSGAEGAALKFYTQDNGSLASRMVITGANVGIGTNAPSRPLEVIGTGNDSVIRVGDGDSDGSAGTSYIEFGANATSWNRQAYIGPASPSNSHLWIVNEENADILFYTNNDHKMVIKNDGNVGIGTNAPSEMLHINKSSGTGSFIRFEDTGGGGVYIGARSNVMELYAGGAERMRIASDGKVGIGTNAPSSKLHVNSEISCGADDNNRAMFGYTPSRFYLGTRQSGTNYLNTVSVTSGNVGIGTNSPAAKLESYITGGGEKGLRLSSNFAGGNTVDFIPAIVGVSNSGFSIDLAGTNRFVINSGGNVGIGTNSPSHRLQVLGATTGGWNGLNLNVVISSSNTYANGHAGGIAFGGAYNSSETQTVLAGVWASRPNAGDGQYAGMVHIGAREHGTSNIEKVLNVSHANVGIGTNAPAAKLDLRSSDSVVAYIIRPSASPTVHIGSSTSAGAQIGYVHANDYAFFGHDAAFNAIVVNSSGSVGIGSTDPEEIVNVASAGAVTPGVIHDLYSTTTTRFPWIGLRKSGSNTKGTVAATEDGDILGKIVFKGVDSGSSFFRESASIIATASGAPDADTQPGMLQFATSNTTSNSVKMTITSSGFVGIGTVTPAYSLQANGTNGGIIGVTRTTGTTTGTLGHVRFGNTNVDSDLANIKGVQDGATDSARLEFETQATGGSATARLTIKSDGVVDINSAKLKINGGSGTDGQVLTTDGAGGIAWETSPGAGSVDGSGTANYVAKWSDSDTIANSVLRDDGNRLAVGAAPSSGGGILHLKDVTSNQAKITLESADAYNNWINFSAATNEMSLGYDKATVGGLVFANSDTLAANIRMVILSTGYVGVGTASPDTLFHMRGAAATLTLESTGNTDDPTIMLQRDNNTGLAARIQLDNSGGDVFFDNTYDNDNGDIYFRTKGTTKRVTIKGSGSVGIGTAAPATIFHIHTDSASAQEIFFDNDGVGPVGITFRTDFATDAGLANFIRFDAADDGGNNTRYSTIESFIVDNTDTEEDGRLTFSTMVAGTDTETMHIVGGNVGIGTNAPDSKLEIAGGGYNSSLKIKGSGSHTGIQFEDSAGNTDGYIYAIDGNVGFLDTGGDWVIRCKNDDYIRFSTNGNTEHMRIKSDGDVGIGTANPTQQLMVWEGSSSVSLGEYSNGAVIWLDGVNGDLAGGDYFNIWADGNSALRFGYGAAQKVSMLSNGSVGIGTVSPSSLLELYSSAPELTIKDGGTWGTNATAYINLKDSSSSMAYIGVTGTAGHLDIKQLKAGSLRLYTNNSERLTIISDGNVGIGTVDPKAPLHLFSNGSANTQQTVLCLGSNTSNRPSLQFSESQNAGFDQGMSIEYRGDFGAGGANGLAINGLGADATTSGAAIATFLSGGSVGIGTTSPSYLLDLESTATGLTHNLKLNKSSTTGDYAEIAFQLWSGAGTGLNTFGGSGTSRPSVVLRAVNESTSSAAGAFVVGTFTGGSTNSTLTEKFRITSAGSVGIGTDAPAAKLEVADGAVLIKNDLGGATDHSELNIFKSTGDNASSAILRVGYDTSAALQISRQRASAAVYLNSLQATSTVYHQIASTNIFTVDSSNVLFYKSAEFDGGIKDKDGSFGTNGYVLTTDGVGDVTWAASPGAGGVDGSGTASYIPKWTDSDTIGNSALFDGGGNNIGIGTNNPQGQLQLHSTASAVQRLVFSNTNSNLTPQQRIEFWEDAATSTSTDAHAAIEYDGGSTYESSNGTLIIRGYGSSANLPIAGFNRSGNVYLGMSGNKKVGINTTTPSTMLHVHSGDILITSGKQLISTNSYTQAPPAMLTTQGPSTGATTLGTGTWGIMMGPQHTRSTTANTYYPGIAFNHLLNNGGAVTYNNHPQAWIGTRLHDTPGSERAFLVFSTKGGTGVTASDVPLERMCIDPVDGLVGIGTTNPQVLLDVYTSDDDIARFETTSTDHGRISIRSGSSGDAQIRFQNAAASKWSIGNDGGDSNKFKIAVGSGAFAASEALILDTSGNLSILGTLTEASSLALKENIEDFTPSLDIINKIRPVKYNKKKESKKEIGLIAEELAELFPELVDRDNEGNPSGVNYSRAVTVLLGGFKELYKEIEELKKRI